ncbi:MAG TPA: hypothetical protein VHV50_01940 [Actinomycetota bacterium]|nr:hypothetical protein [Actinomycetota bacterium]
MRSKTAAVLLCVLTLAACNHNSSLESSRGARAGCRVAKSEKRNAENVMAGLKNHGPSRSPSPRRRC